MRFRLLTLGVVVAVLVAACGGSSTPTTTTKRPSSHKSVTKTKPQTSAGAKTGASSNTSAASTSSSASASSSTASTPTFANVANCTQLDGVGEQFAKAMAAATSGGKYNLNAAVKAYQGLANAAPSAIRPDVQEIASAFTAYASALSKANYKLGTVPSAAQVAALEAAGKVFSQAKLTTAAKAIEAWAVKNCTA